MFKKKHSSASKEFSNLLKVKFRKGSQNLKSLEFIVNKIYGCSLTEIEKISPDMVNFIKNVDLKLNVIKQLAEILKNDEFEGNIFNNLLYYYSNPISVHNNHPYFPIHQSLINIVINRNYLEMKVDKSNFFNTSNSLLNWSHEADNHDGYQSQEYYYQIFGSRIETSILINLESYGANELEENINTLENKTSLKSSEPENMLIFRMICTLYNFSNIKYYHQSSRDNSINEQFKYSKDSKFLSTCLAILNSLSNQYGEENVRKVLRKLEENSYFAETLPDFNVIDLLLKNIELVDKTPIEWILISEGYEQLQ